MLLGRIDFRADNAEFAQYRRCFGVCGALHGRVRTSLDVMKDLFYYSQCLQMNDCTENEKTKIRTPIQTFGRLHSFNNLTQTTESVPVVLSY